MAAALRVLARGPGLADTGLGTTEDRAGIGVERVLVGVRTGTVARVAVRDVEDAVPLVAEDLEVIGGLVTEDGVVVVRFTVEVAVAGEAAAFGVVMVDVGRLEIGTRSDGLPGMTGIFAMWLKHSK